MERELAGKVAIVTGGTRGIGRAVTARLVEMGAMVAASYRSDQEQAEGLVAELTGRGGKVLARQADVASPAAIEEFVSLVLATWGRFDILINNAGILQNKLIAEVTEEEYDTIMAINLKGVFFACQQAARRMADGGRIINISSTVTKMLLPTYGTYSATKGGVDQLTRVLAKELGPRRITVNSLAPGPVDTALFRRGKSAEQIAAMADMAALGRIGTVEDIAGAVSLLVREEAGWISGQCLYANGGMAG